MGKTPKKPKGQLPSKNVRVQVYLGTDDKGKRYYKSFTAPTRKKAEEMAAIWKTTHREKKMGVTSENLTVKDAVKRYIDTKSAAISPATAAAYEKNWRNHLCGNLGHKKIAELKSVDVQLWISELCKKSLAPKTVRNIYGLLSATVRMFAPDLRLSVTLPQKKKPNLYCPNDQDVKALLKFIEGTELEIAVLLAAFGPMRRSEICGLEGRDIEGNMVSVVRSKVFGKDKEWHIKQPKTDGSYRKIEFPDFVIKKLPKTDGPIITVNPNVISDRFAQAVKKSGLRHFRFHDLRHYAASIMHAIGVPDKYILDRGGWETDHVLKAVYRNSIDIEAEKQNQKINQYFTEMM